MLVNAFQLIELLYSFFDFFYTTPSKTVVMKRLLNKD